MRPSELKAALLERERRRRMRLDARDDELRGAARGLAAMLAAMGAERVLLFGSLVVGRTAAHSDIDLAVEGLGSERYFDALGRVLMAAPCRVDLVRLEDAPADLRRAIEETGVVLYGH